MMFWKEWYLDAYNGNFYTLSMLKDKLKTLEEVEEDWKDSLYYCSYNLSKLGLKAAIEHLELLEIMKDCLEIRGYEVTKDKLNELYEIYECCQKWDEEKMITGKTYDEIEDFVKHSSSVDQIFK